MLENIEDMDIAIEPSLDQEGRPHEAVISDLHSRAKPGNAHKTGKKKAEKREVENASPRKNKSRKGRRRKEEESISAVEQKQDLSRVKQKIKQRKEDERQSLKQPQLLKSSGQPNTEPSATK